MSITIAKTVPNGEMDSFTILRICWRGGVPANTNIEAAIEAHGLAFRQFLEAMDESKRPIAACALRTVWLSALHTREQAQRQIDYLSGLPMMAWDRVMNLTDDPKALRESVLAMCARCIAMRTDA